MKIKTFISLLNNKKNIFFEHKNYELIIKRENEVYLNKDKLLKDIINEYKKEEEMEKNILIQKYKENEIIRLFYGRQLSNLYQLIKKEEYNNIKYFIPYNFNKLIKFFNLKNLKIKDEMENKNDNFEEQLEIISNYFNKILKYNYINIENIYEENKIKVDIKYDKKSVYIKSFFYDQYENDCITIFYSLTKNLPLLSNILIFNEETIEEEVLSFLFRVINCKLNCLFAFIVQNINNNQNKYLISKINEFINKKENESLFLILFSQQTEDFLFENIIKFKIFVNIENINQYQNENMENKIKTKLLEKKISIIYSDICGAGKTEYIKENISNNHQNYIYFPIGGYLTRNYLVNRLKEEIKIEKNKENVIHLDLSDSKCENILKEFLFNFLIFNFYGYEEKIFACNYNNLKITIKIELPNTYINYFDKYKFLKLITIEKEINIKETDLNKLPKLKEDNNNNSIKNSKMQIVSKILNYERR